MSNQDAKAEPLTVGLQVVENASGSSTIAELKLDAGAQSDK
jgi:hypothetical protein